MKGMEILSKKLFDQLSKESQQYAKESFSKTNQVIFGIMENAFIKGAVIGIELFADALTGECNESNQIIKNYLKDVLRKK